VIYYYTTEQITQLLYIVNRDAKDIKCYINYLFACYLLWKY